MNLLFLDYAGFRSPLLLAGVLASFPRLCLTSPPATDVDAKARDRAQRREKARRERVVCRARGSGH